MTENKNEFITVKQFLTVTIINRSKHIKIIKFEFEI